MAPAPHFREVQRFRQPWLWAVLLSGLAFLGFAIYSQVVERQPLGNHPASDSHLLLIGVLYLLMVAWFALIALVTEVYDDFIRVQMLWMWVPKRIPFRDIKTAQAVTYRPILEYGGWGIRRGTNGWAYNISGNRGVRLQYQNGKTFLIGSRRAEELALAIQARLGARS